VGGSQGGKEVDGTGQGAVKKAAPDGNGLIPSGIKRVSEPPNWLAKSMERIQGTGPGGSILAEQYGDLVEEGSSAVTWADFQRWATMLGDGWSFRGHAVAKWRLEATLERATTQLVAAAVGPTFHFSQQRLRPGEHEREVLLEFQRGAHQHLTATPSDDELVDWLALMQHHGAPTRLLDWTRSPYVALYFALERAQPKERSALWAIDREWIDKESVRAMKRHDIRCPNPSDFKAMCRYINSILFEPNNPSVIVPANPLRMNDRMTPQQGHFLCNLSHGESFDVALFRMLRNSRTRKPPVRKLIVEQDCRIAMLKELRRMNIHSASLFPGLDGFARSLGIHLEIGLEADKDSWRRAFKKQIAKRKKSPPKAPGQKQLAL
jgi:hypothetical protein